MMEIPTEILFDDHCRAWNQTGEILRGASPHSVIYCEMAPQSDDQQIKRVFSALIHNGLNSITFLTSFVKPFGEALGT